MSDAYNTLRGSEARQQDDFSNMPIYNNVTDHGLPLVPQQEQDEDRRRR